VSGYTDAVSGVVTASEAVGAAVMVVGGAVVLLRAAPSTAARAFTDADYRRLRSDLGRVILVGREVLIVGDIVRTIAVEASLRSVAVLSAIVLIRTVLSLSLDIESDGSLPWRRPLPTPAGAAGPPDPKDTAP